MSDDLRRLLRLLEDEYPAQPVAAQLADLREINRLRAELGMPAVNHQLRVGGVVDGDADRPMPAEQQPARDHSVARDIYRAYRRKVQELERHRAYADQVADATSGRGQTPVRPLATMGTAGGPLLCDHCGRAIRLEGGRFHGVAADVAWAAGPRAGWTSYILGGLVVEIQTNGTLRIYHGYPQGGGHQCCNAAGRADREARDRFRFHVPPEVRDLLRAFLEGEFPDRTPAERRDLVHEIVQTMYSYDPGLGVNRPDPPAAATDD